MKIVVKYLFILMPIVAIGQKAPFHIQQEKLNLLPFGAVKPAGWIKTQMQYDIKGFVGNLESIVPDLVDDPIYSARLHKHSKAKDLGNLKEGDIGGDDQYKWWNAETQSNWRDGYIRNVLLLNDIAAVKKVKAYVYKIMATQDNDGYLGIYDKDLRYNFSSENGELWAKTTLLRGLLAYYEATNDKIVWHSIVRAVDDVMKNYPLYTSNPFYAGKEFSGGVAHGLTFTDICDAMYRLTKNPTYREYALFLYQNFSENFSFEKDVQLKSILNPDYKLQGHGVHTYEHLRPLTVAAFSTGDKEFKNALKIFLKRIEQATTASGGPIGDEWIGGRKANATKTGYEYCSVHELMDSYAGLLQKTGDPIFANKMETIFYNAAQGARNPDHSCIAYLKTDNSYMMTGTLNDAMNGDAKQTRYKYSPAHKDAAVCCVPNAGRITPYFVQNMWMKEADTTLIATLLGPSIVQTKIKGTDVQVNEITNYPYEHSFSFQLQIAKPKRFTIKIRKPEWVKNIQCNKQYAIEEDYIVIRKEFTNKETITLHFDAEVLQQQDVNGEYYFTYGALVFARSIPATATVGKTYTNQFKDYLYTPDDKTEYAFVGDNKATYTNGTVQLLATNNSTHAVEKITLIPIGKTILRQTTFK